MDGADYWDVTQTYIKVKKDGKLIAEGRIHYQLMCWEWDEDDDTHYRTSNSDEGALILNGKRYDNPEAYEKEYGFEIVDWGDERLIDEYETEDEALDGFEEAIKREIEYQKESSDCNQSNLIDDGISKKEEEEDVGGEQNLEDYPITKILNSISESEIQESGKTKYEIAAEILANNNSKKERENPGLRLGRLLPEQVKILEKKEKTKMLENKYQGKGGYIRFLQDPDSWKNIADRYSPKLNNEDIYTSIESDSADDLFEKFCSIPLKSHPNLRESFYFIVMSLGKTVNKHIDLLISYDFKEKVEAIDPDFVKNNEEKITRAREHRLKSNKNSGCMSIFILTF